MEGLGINFQTVFAKKLLPFLRNKKKRVRPRRRYYCTVRPGKLIADTFNRKQREQYRPTEDFIFENVFWAYKYFLYI